MQVTKITQLAQSWGLNPGLTPKFVLPQKGEKEAEVREEQGGAFRGLGGQHEVMRIPIRAARCLASLLPFRALSLSLSLFPISHPLPSTPAPTATPLPP